MALIFRESFLRRGVVGFLEVVERLRVGAINNWSVALILAVVLARVVWELAMVLGEPWLGSWVVPKWQDFAQADVDVQVLYRCTLIAGCGGLQVSSGNACEEGQSSLRDEGWKFATSFLERPGYRQMPRCGKEACCVRKMSPAVVPRIE